MNRRTIKDFLALYGVQGATLILPLLTLPLLTRVLGLEEFGRLALIQAVFLILFLIIDYGFSFSGSRYIAANLGSPSVISEYVSTVISAKILLSLLYLTISSVLYIGIDAFQQNGRLFLAGVVYGFMQGWSPVWFFQGIGKLPLYAIVDTAFRVASVVAVFLFVNSSSDAWLVLAFNSLGALCGVCYGIHSIYKIVEFKFPTYRQGFSALKDGYGMFMFRILASSLGTINPVLLGYLSNPIAVAHYTGADRLAAGVRSVNTPFNQIFLVKISASLSNSYDVARIQFRRSFSLMLAINIVLGVIAFVLAPFLIPLILGSDFVDSIDLFRIIILSSPIFVLGNALGMQWMIPNRMDVQYNRIISLAAVINIILMTYLVPKYQAYGATVSFITCEVVICTVIIFYLTLAKVNPFNSKAVEPPQSQV